MEFKIGQTVKVKSNASGSDRTYAGRRGIVVKFDHSLPWKCPRGQLAPEAFVCVHFIPKTALEMRRGSPIALLHSENLALSSAYALSAR